MTNGIFPNPMRTTTAVGSFPQGGSSKGLVQGVADPDPSTRNALRSGYIDPNEALPMWGGLAITDFVGGKAGGPVDALGSRLARATGVANVTGFTVFDQSHHMLMFPNNPVPLAYNGMTISYYNLGSRARIALPIADADAAALIDGASNGLIGWDYANQRLVVNAAAAQALPLRIIDVELKNSIGITYDPATGNTQFIPTASMALVQLGKDG